MLIDDDTKLLFMYIDLTFCKYISKNKINNLILNQKIPEWQANIQHIIQMYSISECDI